MKKILIALVAVIGLSGCTDPETATRVLEDSGYTDIQITGYNYFSCAESDRIHTGFKAKGPTGREVTGTVCAGLLFKNSTIRFD